MEVELGVGAGVVQRLPALRDGDAVAFGLVWAGLGLVAGDGLVLVGHRLVGLWLGLWLGLGLGLAETAPEWPAGAGILSLPPACVTPVPPGFVRLVRGSLVPGLARADPAPGLLPGTFAPALPSGDRGGFGDP